VKGNTSKREESKKQERRIDGNWRSDKENNKVNLQLEK
jgi:hypothetical protein